MEMTHHRGDRALILPGASCGAALTTLLLLLLASGSSNAATIVNTFYANAAQGGADPGSATCDSSSAMHVGGAVYTQTLSWTSGVCITRQPSDHRSHFPWQMGSYMCGSPDCIVSSRLTCTPSGTTTVEFFTDSDCTVATVSGAHIDANTLRNTRSSYQADGHCDATCAGCVDIGSSFSLFDTGLSATACVSKLKITPNATCLGAWVNAAHPGDPHTGTQLANMFLASNSDHSQSFQIAGCSASSSAGGAPGGGGGADESHGFRNFVMFLLAVGLALGGYDFWDTKQGGAGVRGLVTKVQALIAGEKTPAGDALATGGGVGSGGGGIYASARESTFLGYTWVL